jgi:hypothetical protein
VNEHPPQTSENLYEAFQNFYSEFPNTLSLTINNEIQHTLLSITQLSKLITNSHSKTIIWQNNVQENIKPISLILDSQLNQDQLLQQILTLANEISSSIKYETPLQFGDIESKIDNLTSAIPNACSYLINTEMNVLKNLLDHQGELICTAKKCSESQSEEILKKLKETLN